MMNEKDCKHMCSQSCMQDRNKAWINKLRLKHYNYKDTHHANFPNTMCHNVLFCLFATISSFLKPIISWIIQASTQEPHHQKVAWWKINKEHNQLLLSLEMYVQEYDRSSTISPCHKVEYLPSKKHKRYIAYMCNKYLPSL